jgi:hypothetical protein
MQPVKNGRADMPSSSGAGSPADQPSDMHALQQAGYLAQLTDAAEGMGEPSARERGGASSSGGMDGAAATSTAASEGEPDAPAADDDEP